MLQLTIDQLKFLQSQLPAETFLLIDYQIINSKNSNILTDSEVTFIKNLLLGGLSCEYNYSILNESQIKQACEIEESLRKRGLISVIGNRVTFLATRPMQADKALPPELTVDPRHIISGLHSRVQRLEEKNIELAREVNQQRLLIARLIEVQLAWSMHSKEQNALVSGLSKQISMMAQIIRSIPPTSGNNFSAPITSTTSTPSTHKRKRSPASFFADSVLSFTPPSSPPPAPDMTTLLSTDEREAAAKRPKIIDPTPLMLYRDSPQAIPGNETTQPTDAMPQISGDLPTTDLNDFEKWLAESNFPAIELEHDKLAAIIHPHETRQPTDVPPQTSSYLLEIQSSEYSKLTKPIRRNKTLQPTDAMPQTSSLVESYDLYGFGKLWAAPAIDSNAKSELAQTIPGNRQPRPIMPQASSDLPPIDFRDYDQLDKPTFRR